MSQKLKTERSDPVTWGNPANLTTERCSGDDQNITHNPAGQLYHPGLGFLLQGGLSFYNNADEPHKSLCNADLVYTVHHIGRSLQCKVWRL